MPYYASIDPVTEKPILEGLLRFKAGLDEKGPPPRSLSQTLLLATWNIREFDSAKYGPRSRECLFYMAEMIDRFDLVAIQEVSDDLTALRQLMRILGGWWKVLFTDVTVGRRGNRERMAFLYDSRKIIHGGLAGEVVIPPIESNGKTVNPSEQLARTPFIVGFQAGWFRFTICTAHILYGTAKANDPQRLAEIRALSRFLADRAQEKHAWARNMILLGDFNIFDTTDATLGAITEAGFVIPEQLKRLPSNAPRTKHYDQIAFLSKRVQDQLKLSKAGVFPFFDYVYRDGPEDEAANATLMGSAYVANAKKRARTDKEKTAYYRAWRTFQMSDHFPMWIELKTDFSTQYLRRKLNRLSHQESKRDGGEAREGSEYGKT